MCVQFMSDRFFFLCNHLLTQKMFIHSLDLHMFFLDEIMYKTLKIEKKIYNISILNVLDLILIYVFLVLTHV